MKIKRFRAKSFSEALELVKKELGEDAVVLSTEEKKGIIPSVEVVAAIDYDDPSENYKNFSSQINKKPDLNNSLEPEASEIRQLLSEIAYLKDSINELKRYGYELTLPEKKREIFNYLRERAIRDEFSLRLCNRVSTKEELLRQISMDLKIKRTVFNRRAIMLIGPTGAGKTTTIAKLAWIAISQGQKAALLSLDTYRIGAMEQIRIYSRIMGIPLLVVSGVEELKEGLEKFSSRDTVLIDTTGRSPSDRRYISQLSSIITELKNLPGDFSLELHLLISSNSDESSMIEAYNHYRELPINCIAFTKVDEAVRFGHLYNIYLTYQKPVAYITTGQTVPDDIKFPDQRELASLFLRKGYFCKEVVNV
ncbi:MAG: flagellar biosynthesis protein FlhF [Thermodesulfovibrionales bacterium]|nr:flagellar biosynthesis protein FlhF [Thermodesulfovibrionales bacterium]